MAVDEYSATLSGQYLKSCEKILVRFLAEPIELSVSMEPLSKRLVKATFTGQPSLAKLRGSPRARYGLPGTYYLRPPTHGIPIRILDLAIGGVAITPPETSVPRGEVVEISFSLKHRIIRARCRLVAKEPDRWRLAFVKLANADEQAISSTLFEVEVAARKSLSPRELEIQSALDAQDRVRYPLIDASIVEGNRIKLLALDEEACTGPLDAMPNELEEIKTLANYLRISDPADVNRFLVGHGIRALIRDRLLLAYFELAAKVTKSDMHAQVLSAVEAVRAAHDKVRSVTQSRNQAIPKPSSGDQANEKLVIANSIFQIFGLDSRETITGDLIDTLAELAIALPAPSYTLRYRVTEHKPDPQESMLVSALQQIFPNLAIG